MANTRIAKTIRVKGHPGLSGWVYQEEIDGLLLTSRCDHCNHSDLFHYKDGYFFCRLCEEREGETYGHCGYAT